MCNRRSSNDFVLIRHRLLVEAGRLSLLLRFTDLTKVILDALANVRLKEPEYLLEVRLIQAEYMVRSLGEAEQLYNKSSVDVRGTSIEIRNIHSSFSRHVFVRLN